MPKEKTVLYFASHNPYKLNAVIKTLQYWGGKYKDLVEIRPIPKGIPEPVEGKTSLMENSRIKAEWYSKHTGLPCFSDDSGFFVDAFGGKPGVLARRWTDETNETLHGKTLRLLGDNPNRRAHNTSSICYYYKDKGSKYLIQREATVYGTITDKNYAPPSHTAQDGIFKPDGSSKTVSQMSEKESMNPKFSAKSAVFLMMLEAIFG